jgi:GDP-4-dehydro-6-deoxy-D-mannose reductase
MISTSSADWLILATGTTGSLGSQMPAGVVALTSRLETPGETKIAELCSIVSAHPGRRIALVHCAALTSVQECEANVERAYKLNVEGATSWFEAAEANGIERFILVSTSHVYKAPATATPLDIDAPVEPRSAYARTKWQAEETLREKARSSRLKLSVARVFSLLSPSIRPGFLQHSLIQRAENNDSSPIPGFGLARDFIDAREACSILARLAASSDFPALVNICSGKPTTVGDLAKRIFTDRGADLSLLNGAPPRPTDITYLVGVPTPFK